MNGDMADEILKKLYKQQADAANLSVNSAETSRILRRYVASSMNTEIQNVSIVFLQGSYWAVLPNPHNQAEMIRLQAVRSNSGVEFQEPDPN
jgi:hypothetical protein